jgi:SAM-dependent methyltransferase
MANDLNIEKAILLSSPDISNAEQVLLRNVSPLLHPHDNMLSGQDALHYLSVGLSASRCIHKAIGGYYNGINEILDFPCGSGRVLRFLRAMFPTSNITASDIDSEMLDFCTKTFSAECFMSKSNFGDLFLSKHYDLIWCGSLFTHINELTAISLLNFFQRHLSDRGICIFTTHGKLSFDWLCNGTVTYGLTQAAVQVLIRDWQSLGYAFVNYPEHLGYPLNYGVSVATSQKVRYLASLVGGMKESMFIEHGWDNHQDVYAFTNRMIVTNISRKY